MRAHEFNPALYEFWLKHAKPGRIGLFHLDFPPAKLLDWGQKELTPDHRPSRWVHGFLFIETRDGDAWIAESDRNIPLPGFRHKLNGPQTKSIRKWAIVAVDEAVVLDSRMTEEQYLVARRRVDELMYEHYSYSLLALAGTWAAIRHHNLAHHSLLHRHYAMHCSQFVRECLRAAGADFLCGDVSAENTVPELIYQSLPIVAEWKN